MFKREDVDVTCTPVSIIDGKLNYFCHIAIGDYFIGMHFPSGKLSYSSINFSRVNANVFAQNMMQYRALFDNYALQYDSRNNDTTQYDAYFTSEIIPCF